MTIGIISDTHGYFHPSIPSVFESVDLILHAGDVGSQDVLTGLRAIAPVRAVYGNVDGGAFRKELPLEEKFERDGLSFRMTHIAGRPGRWQNAMDRKLGAEPPDVFVCGHSHILKIERVAELGGMLFINPGAAGRQGLHRVKTCVRLSIQDGKAVQADVVHLDE